jgi:hypothetical protein
MHIRIANMKIDNMKHNLPFNNCFGPNFGTDIANIRQIEEFRARQGIPAAQNRILDRLALNLESYYGRTRWMWR